ncbi:UNVERIFIED_CONTAM: hypothetical protein GTU68_026404 [Idotea baltica]|nr:hypothetical protein [Idotea baltica]
MARTSIIQRNLKRKRLVIKYVKTRKSTNERWDAQMLLQKLPVNSSATRIRNRCFITGRSRAIYKKFNLCRNKIREYAMNGYIPGLRRASW